GSRLAPALLREPEPLLPTPRRCVPTCAHPTPSGAVPADLGVGGRDLPATRRTASTTIRVRLSRPRPASRTRPDGGGRFRRAPILAPQPRLCGPPATIASAPRARRAQRPQRRPPSTTAARSPTARCRTPRR